MEETPRKTRMQDVVQTGIVLLLLFSLLVVGGISLSYLVDNRRLEARFELLEDDYKKRVRESEYLCEQRIGRVSEDLSSLSYTMNKRLRDLESSSNDNKNNK